MSENGPCFVGNDSNSTYLNPWSWNNEVNLLYIDQPVQVGFSYDTPTNVTASLLKEQFEGWQYTPADFSDGGVPDTNLTFLVATTGSQNLNFTANTTQHAAVATWHFAQTWFEEFPAYKPHDEQISLFTESYGGHYGPAFVSHFLRQNELIANGTITGPGVHYLHMNTLGIVNGCIDLEEGAWAYASFAVNNTYGVKAFNESEYHHAMWELSRPDGIVDKIHECQRLRNSLDPNDYGEVEKVTTFCRDVIMYAENTTADLYIHNAETGWFDITHPGQDPFPPMYFEAFLNQHWVQKALGVPVNFSSNSAAVYQGFSATGDAVRGGMIEDIAYILDYGVKVAMMYGDRDYACNWVQGEKTSLKIPWASRSHFNDAGYTPLVLSPFHSGGLTRQYGNLSFTRVYQAGHLVPAYQPQAAYEIFMRALTGRDIATGEVVLQDVASKGEQYSTHGPSDAWWMKSDVLPAPPHECYYLDMGRCTEEEKEWVFDGTAIVKDWIVVGRNMSKLEHLYTDHGSAGQVPLAGE